MTNCTIFEEVGECCYRNTDSGVYFARVKLKGKQYRQSLGAKSVYEIRRKLADFRHDLERIDPQRNRTTSD